MRIHSNKIPDIVSEFLLTRVIPKAPNSATQFGYGFLVPYVAKTAQDMAGNTLLKSLGIIDAEGAIDLDTARTSANTALDKAGGRVTLYGVSFDRSDLDALFEIAQKFGG